MYVVSDQLITELDNPITLKHFTILAAVRARVYFHNSPAGNFAISIYQGIDLIKSYSFTSASVKTALGTADDYLEVDLALPGKCSLLPGEYSLVLEATGYTYSDSSWLGWSKDYKDYFGVCTGTPSDFSEYPYAFKLIEYSDREVF